MENSRLFCNFPANNMGGYQNNEGGMTLNPYFSDLQRRTDCWSTLHKTVTPGPRLRPKSSLKEILRHQCGTSTFEDDPFHQFRNRWISAAPQATNSVHTSPFGPSIYQSDYLSPPRPCSLEFDAERKHFASKLPPRHNMFRSGRMTDAQRKDDWVPKRPVLYSAAMNKVPCRNPRLSNLSYTGNFFLDEGFGPYMSETKEQFDQPVNQLYRNDYYALPSGFTRHQGIQMFDDSDPWAKDDSHCPLPPQRYNPWPRFLMGHEQLINRGYRPQNLQDVKEVTVMGTTCSEAQDFFL